MKPYADHYAQLDAAHQREVDWQAGYEIALDEVATEIDNDLKTRRSNALSRTHGNVVR